MFRRPDNVPTARHCSDGQTMFRRPDNVPTARPRVPTARQCSDGQITCSDGRTCSDNYRRVPTRGDVTTTKSVPTALRVGTKCSDGSSRRNNRKSQVFRRRTASEQGVPTADQHPSEALPYRRERCWPASAPLADVKTGPTTTDSIIKDEEDDDRAERRREDFTNITLYYCLIFISIMCSNYNAHEFAICFKDYRIV